MKLLKVAPKKVSDDYRPRLSEAEYDLFHRELSSATSYLEFGTGGSTLLAAELGIRRIVSVDSDQAWSRRIGDRIASQRSTAAIDLIHCDVGKTGRWGTPVDRRQIASWPHYFMLPWQRFLSANESPDLIHVDGRFRVACVLYSLLNLCFRRQEPMAKTPRIMIHDFPNRPYYHKILEYVSIVAETDTLVVTCQRTDLSLPQLLNDMLLFQFDTR